MALRMPGFQEATFPRPKWDGAPLAGRKILLYTEQGLGDTLQFIRYVALVKQRGGTVIVACPKSMLPFLGRCSEIDYLVVTGSPWPDCDVHASLMSLPGILNTTLPTIPATVPYLHADPALVDRWRAELTAIPGFKVGIAWQGNPKFLTDRRRSIPLRAFLPLARVSCVTLISLQKGPGIEQLTALADRLAVLDLARRLDETAGAFMDTAAVMKSLDLVVTCDTSLAHLAGGLGVPVWLALHVGADRRGSWAATTAPGTRPCGYFGKAVGVTGTEFSSAWRRSCAITLPPEDCPCPSRRASYSTRSPSCTLKVSASPTCQSWKTFWLNGRH